MSNLFNKDALQGRMLFAIPKKGMCSLPSHPRQLPPWHPLTPKSVPLCPSNPPGRLYEKCLELLSGADIQFKRQNRLDVALVQNHPMAL